MSHTLVLTQFLNQADSYNKQNSFSSEAPDACDLLDYLPFAFFLSTAMYFIVSVLKINTTITAQKGLSTPQHYEQVNSTWQKQNHNTEQRVTITLAGETEKAQYTT